MPLTLGLYTKEIKLECQGYLHEEFFSFISFIKVWRKFANQKDILPAQIVKNVCWNRKSLLCCKSCIFDCLHLAEYISLFCLFCFYIFGFSLFISGSQE